MLSYFSLVQLFATPWTVADQAPLSMGVSRQEFWSGPPFPSPGIFPHPGIKPVAFTSSPWQVGSLPPAPSGKPVTPFMISFTHSHRGPKYQVENSGNKQFLSFTSCAFLSRLLSPAARHPAWRVNSSCAPGQSLRSPGWSLEWQGACVHVALYLIKVPKVQE